MPAQVRSLAVLVACLAALCSPNTARAQGCVPCDWNSDNVLGFEDYCDYLTAWLNDQAQGTTVADYNADGVTNALDIMLFLNCWLAPQACPRNPPVPANDEPENAIVLPPLGGQFTLPPLIWATAPAVPDQPTCEVGSPAGVPHDIWYKWTAPANGTVSIDTLPCAWDTKIAAYADSGIPPQWANRDWCNDTAADGGQQAELIFAVDANQLYWIEIGGTPAPFNPANCPVVTPGMEGRGEFQLAFVPAAATGCALCDWDEDGEINDQDGILYASDFFNDIANGTTNADINHDGVTNGDDATLFELLWFTPTPTCTGDPFPPNDHCATALPGWGWNFHWYTYLTRASTGPEGQGDDAEIKIANDTWFHYTPGCDARLQIRTSHPDLDTRLAVYEVPQGACEGLRFSDAIASNDDYEHLLSSRVEINAQAGHSYLIQVGLSPVTVDPPFTIGWADAPVSVAIELVANDIGPANDDCTNSIGLAAPTALTPAYAFANLMRATMDGPIHPECFDDGLFIINDDAWFHFTSDPAAPRAYTLTFLGDDDVIDARAAVYETANCNNLDTKIVACGQSPINGTTPCVTWVAQPNRRHLIRVGSEFINNLRCVGLRISVSTGPDLCPQPPGQRRYRIVEIAGVSTGVSWSLSVQGPAFAVQRTNIPPIPAGQGPAAFVERINSEVFGAGCSPNLQVTRARRNSGIFIISARGSEPVAPQFWVGTNPAGPTTCGGPYPLTCAVNPLFSGVPMSGLDCNNNAEDDTLDIAFGTSLDIDGNNVPDECQKRVCPDWNRDGTVNSTDVSDFINDWFEDQLYGSLATEINHDGVSNSTDVSDYINLWFASPPECSK